MKLTDKTTIHFDLDGTLIDSVPDLTLAINEMLIMLDRENVEEKNVRSWVGNGAQTLVKRALLGKKEIDSLSVDAALFEEGLALFLKAYQKHLCHATMLYPNVKETLEALKQKGYTLSIITNKPIDFVEPLLMGLEIDEYFSAILGGDSLSQKKPHPLPLEHMCQTLDVSIASSVMVGDSKNDILAANACGMDAIAVSYGYNYGEDIAQYKPLGVVDDFATLLEYL